MRHVLIIFLIFYGKMNSILKIIFRQTEHFLRLTKTSLHAFQLQNNLFDTKDIPHCAFSYDLRNELQLIEKYLRSTCFLLQRALYRVQALRQLRGGLPIRINDNNIDQYQGNLSEELKHIRQLIGSTIEEYELTKSPLNSLQILFKQLEENFEILLDYMDRMPRHKSTLYLGNLVSDTLEKFYLILNSLARFAKDIEQFEKK